MSRFDKIELEAYCCLCEEKTIVPIAVPEGWFIPDQCEENKAFCPKHILIKQFQSNCSGCVGGWGECSMWRPFSSANARDITEEELQVIESGRCPRRTNGTMIVTKHKSGFHEMEDVDLSDACSKKAGKAFADAIREYCEKYQ